MTLKVGMCFATVDVGATDGLFDDDGDGYYENDWAAPTDPKMNVGSGAGSSRYNGLPNLKGGVQSLIGTIIAVRPIKHSLTTGRTVGCFEIMVSDWVNPASLVRSGMIMIIQPLIILMADITK